MRDCISPHFLSSFPSASIGRQPAAGLSPPLGLGLSCGRQSCLQTLAIHGAQWGRQSCLQPPFRRLANRKHSRSSLFGFVSCRYRNGKPEKFVRRRASRLKAGCTVESLAQAGKPHVGQDGIFLPIGNRPLRVFIPFHGPKTHADSQDWLPHKRAKAERHEAGERANCVSGLLDGGLKGRLQARLPATQGGRLHPTKGQSRAADFSPPAADFTALAERRAEAHRRLKSAPPYKMVRACAWFAGLALCFSSPVWSQQTAASEEILRHAVELQQKGDVAAAIPEYRAYLKQVPNNVIALSNLGAALAHAGLYADAIVEYRKALGVQPANDRVRLNLALAYYKASEISAAAEEAERVLAKQPGEQQVVFLLADCDLRLGENKKVIDLLTPLEPQMAGNMAFNYMLGTALIRDKETARGQLLVDRILRVGDSAEARLMMGETKLSVADFKGALEDFQKAVELNPALPDVYSYYGMALAATGDTPQAAVAFRKELDSNPNDYTSNVQLGVLLKQDEDYAGARRCFEQALSVRPRDAAVRYQLATLDLENGQVDKARTELEALTKEIPQFVEAHVSLATVYYRLKRREDGDKQREIVLQLNAEKQAAEPGAKGK